MSDINNQLRSTYEELLNEHRLEHLTHSEASLNEAREAMLKDGWLDSLGSTAEEFQAMVRENSKDPMQSANSVLADIAANVECAIRLRGGEVPCCVFVGCFPLAEIQACLAPVHGGALVLVNVGLMQILHQVAKVFLHSYEWLRAGVDDSDCITIGSVDAELESMETLRATVEWDSIGWTRPDSIRAITAILDADRYHGSVTYAPRQPIPGGGKGVTLGMIVDYAESFVVAHEYAHLLLGHRTLADLKTPTGTVRDVLKASREQEFEADELAASIVLASADWSSPNGEFDMNARVAGIALAFVCLSFHSLSHKGVGCFHPDADAMEDHPSPIKRAARVIEMLHQRYGKSVSGLARVCMGWQALIVEDVASSLEDLSKAKSLEKEAQSLYEQEDYEIAAPLFRQVTDLRESALGESSLSIAAPLSNLGNCLLALGQPGEAEPTFLRSLAICEAAGSVAGQYLPQILEILAMHYAERENDNSANRYFVRAIDEWEALGVEYIELFLNCCGAYLHWLLAHRHGGDAKALSARVVGVLQQSYGQDHPKVRDAMRWDTEIRKLIRERE